MQDIHDITPPVQVGIDPAIIKYVLIGFGLMLLLAVSLIALRYFIKRRKQKKDKTLFLPLPLPPDVAALKELDLLGDFMEKYPRVFCFKISGVFKTFIGKQFKINAPEMTTEELMMHLRHLDIDRGSAATAREFLLSLDDIKYAGATPSMDKMKRDHNFVISFIQSVAKKKTGQSYESRFRYTTGKKFKKITCKTDWDKKNGP